jgi:hypothetical protein
LQKSEKALAKRPMNDKRIEAINADQSVPKKTKIVQNKNQAPPEPGESSTGMKITKTPTVRQTSAKRRSSGPTRKKSPVARKGKTSTPPETGTPAGSSDEQIRLRAYFISERRRRFGLPGDVDSDWLEARRQLLSETGPR